MQQEILLPSTWVFSLGVLIHRCGIYLKTLIVTVSLVLKFVMIHYEIIVVKDYAHAFTLLFP